jgi:ABC-type sugar transport system substrate-binding protein
MSEVTAVFAANDHLALGILRALHERDRRVPGDISLVGFDDVPEAAYFIPPLTTIRPDFYGVAAASIDLLLEQVRDGERKAERRILTPTLVKRESVAPPSALSGRRARPALVVAAIAMRRLPAPPLYRRDALRRRSRQSAPGNAAS